MRKSNPPTATKTKPLGGIPYRRAVLFSLLFLAACTGSRDRTARFEPAGEGECRTLDSAFARSGWGEPLAMTGRVTLDVKQYRVQGRFHLNASGTGNVTFEFTGTMALGGHHEDVVLALFRDTLRVLDRERERLYEGDEVDALVREGLDVDWDMDELVRRIILSPPDCARLSQVSLTDRGGSKVRLEGRVDGERFLLDFEDGTVGETSWPVAGPGRRGDRMTVSYDWVSASGVRSLRGMVAFLEGRRWRVKLEAE